MRIKFGPDVAFISLFILLLICIVIPMPGWLLDFLISLNICGTMLILIISLNISSAIELPSFPSILLVTTLLRLSLNVASTRAILTTGDAGRVISAFGNFVISGNYFAGAVVFLIITIIQLIVVTKGAERVAEVSARFTLDAMPGKQMSIDAELRSGHITQEEAIKRRTNLAIESQFFGSMDGAMKFVKGDAIAGILISIINIIGGMLTGIIVRNLSLQEAISRYTILSIGDGLVSQIPSLIISVSAGIIITRISTIKKAGLGKEIFVGLTQKPILIFIAAVVAILFSLLPHIPFIPFFLIGITLAIAYRKLRNSEPHHLSNHLVEETHKKLSQCDNSTSLNQESVSPFAEPITLVISNKLCEDPSIGSAEYIIKEIVPSIRKRFIDKLGFRMPGIHIIVSEGSEPAFTLLVYETEVASFTFKENALFTIDSKYSEDAITELLGGEYVKYYTDDGPKTEGDKLRIGQVLPEIIYAQVQRHIRDLFGIQETSELIEELSQRYPILIRETIPKAVSISTLSEVLKNLLFEGVSIKNMKSILETIGRYAPFEKSPNLLTEFVRVSLARQICQTLSINNRLNVSILSSEINKIILDSIAEVEGEQILSISPENARKVIEAIRTARYASNLPFVILTDFETRRFIKKIIEYELPFCPVLSFKEVSPYVKIEPIGMINL